MQAGLDLSKDGNKEMKCFPCSPGRQGEYCKMVVKFEEDPERQNSNSGNHKNR
jgi:hypothetical protein